MKAHIGVDEKSGLVHSVVDTAANVADVTQVGKLLRARKAPSVPMRVIQELKSAPNMLTARSSGRLLHAAAVIRSIRKTAFCIKLCA